MGSFLSSIVSDIVLEDLKSISLNNLSVVHHFIFVDDIAHAMNKKHISERCEVFNEYHPRLKFIIEKSD